MLRSLKRLFNRQPWREPVVALYGKIVAHARTPRFYTDWGVPDTVDGRFDMIAVHAGLVIRRLRDSGDDGKAVAQELFDLMFADMDRNLREMGVGDMSVGKHVRKMAEAYFGRTVAFDVALMPGAEPESLPEALRRNLYRKNPEVTDAQVRAVARFMRASHDRLAAFSLAEMVAASALFAPLEGAA